jgi:hypothetical protein
LKKDKGGSVIFLSHCNSDGTMLLPLIAELKKHDVEVWTYEEEIAPGQSFPSRMSEALTQCDHMLVGWSAAAAKSPHVANEIDAFYTQHPEPGRLLFLRLDGEPIPALHGSRIFVEFGNAASDVAAIKAWVTGDKAPALQSLPAEVPPPDALAQFPLGPMFPPDRIPESLINAYADLFGTKVSAQRVVNRAIHLRREADPNDPELTVLRHAELPQVEIGSDNYWYQAFTQAGMHSPRMLAALVLAHPDHQLSDNSRRERAQLLIALREHGKETRQ